MNISNRLNRKHEERTFSTSCFFFSTPLSTGNRRRRAGGEDMMIMIEMMVMMMVIMVIIVIMEICLIVVHEAKLSLSNDFDHITIVDNFQVKFCEREEASRKKRSFGQTTKHGRGGHLHHHHLRHHLHYHP